MDLATVFSWASLTVVPVVALLYCLGKYLEPNIDPREPHFVASTVPFIGHVVGIFRHGPRYFQHTRYFSSENFLFEGLSTVTNAKPSAKTKSPIHTLGVAGKKLYVVTGPDLISAVSRNAKSLVFHPFISQVAMRLLKCSAEARRIIEHNIDGSRGKEGYYIELHDKIVSALSPSSELNRMSVTMLTESRSRFLRPLEESCAEEDGRVVDLHAWVRHLVSSCSTTALYGPDNPFLSDSSLEQAFWDFNSDLNMLLLNAWPAVTARKGCRGRARLAAAFTSYFETGGHLRSSHYIRSRYNAATKYDTGIADIGLFEATDLIGILVNTIPTVFYLLLHIFSQPLLLQEIRNEFVGSALEKLSDGAKSTVILSHVRERCPLLISAFQETLRCYSFFASTRLVLEDTYLAGGRFLLKEGSLVQMPNSVLHYDSSAWDQAPTFQAKRFLPSEATNREKSIAEGTEQPSTKNAEASVSNRHYRPFGGGNTLCPGRHFASSEILGLVAMILWRFDMTPASGKWAIPTAKQESVVEGVFPPSNDVKVRFSRRAGVQGDWDIVYS